MHPVSFASLASVCIILALPSAVLAQSRIRPSGASIGVGLAYQSDSRGGELSPVGPVVSAQLRRRLGAWFAVRGLASVARFGERQFEARLERLPRFDRGIWKIVPVTLGVAW
jgi:hypothetical protein